MKVDLVLIIFIQVVSAGYMELLPASTPDHIFEKIKLNSSI